MARQKEFGFAGECISIGGRIRRNGPEGQTIDPIAITVRAVETCGKLKRVKSLLEWRNWQTHGTQNPASFTGYEGSTPSSSTNNP